MATITKAFINQVCKYHKFFNEVDASLINEICEYFEALGNVAELDITQHRHFFEERFEKRWYSYSGSIYDLRDKIDGRGDKSKLNATEQIRQWWNDFAQIVSGTDEARSDLVMPKLRIRNIKNFCKSVLNDSKMDFDCQMVQHLEQVLHDGDENAYASEELIKHILSLYEHRWMQIKDTRTNYTYGLEPKNDLWVSFARKLNRQCNIGIIKILMPTIVNDKDPHDGTYFDKLDEINNLFIGHKNILYHIPSLKKRLEKFSFTRLKPADKKEYPFTIEELMELKSLSMFEQDKVLKDSCHSLWDFINNNLFSALKLKSTVKVELPYDLFSDLFKLIDNYYLFKRDKQPYHNFKKETKKFLDNLYTRDAKVVYAFYSQKIVDKNANHFVFQLLMKILKGDKYNIDPFIRLLSFFVFKQNAYFKSESQEQTNLLNVWSNAESIGGLLTSLYTMRFEFNMLHTIFGKQVTISICDKKNIIPYELHTIYQKILHLMTHSEKGVYYIDSINALREEIAALRAYEESRYWFFKNESVCEWLAQADGNLDPSNWIEPELILSVLLDQDWYDINMMKDFFCGFFNTYVQRKISQLNIKSRNNLLFKEFLSTLEPDKKFQLLTAINEADPRQAKENFVVNFDRFMQQSVPEVKPPIRKELFNPQNVKVRDLITAYEEQVACQNLCPQEKIKYNRFFYKLKAPLIDAEETARISESTEKTSEPLSMRI